MRRRLIRSLHFIGQFTMEISHKTFVNEMTIYVTNKILKIMLKIIATLLFKKQQCLQTVQSLS